MTSKEFSEKKSCFDEFIYDIAPVAAYGVFTPSTTNNSIKRVGKVTCVDGTVINEDYYKFVEERYAKAKEEYDQRYTDAKYCGIKQINERIDKCNTIDESGENVPP